MGHTFQHLCIPSLECWKFLYSYQYSWALSWDATRLLGKDLILLDLAFKDLLGGNRLMLRLVLIYFPLIKVRPFCVFQPNILWVMTFSSLAGERRHSSQTVSAAGTVTSNPFGWFFPKTGAFLKCICQSIFSWIVESDSPHLWSFLSMKPSPLVFWHVSSSHHDFPGLSSLSSQLRSYQALLVHPCPAHSL